MTDKLFNKLWKDALAQPNQEFYIYEYGYPEWFDDISHDSGEVTDILCRIHTAAHMTVREIIDTAGITQSAFSLKFCIPLRTIEHWAAGTRECSHYIRLAFCRELGILERTEKNE